MKKTALVLLALLLAVPTAGAKTRSATISGTFATGGQTMAGWRVLAVASSGRAVSARVQNLRFSLNVRKADLNGMSLQLVDGAGAYAGPVLLRHVKKVGATRFSAKAETALGRIDLKRGYAAVRSALAGDMVLATGSAKVRLNTQGAPVGAGLLGLASKAKAKRAARAGDGGGGSSSCSPSAGDPAAAARGVLHPDLARRRAVGRPLAGSDLHRSRSVAECRGPCPAIGARRRRVVPGHRRSPLVADVTAVRPAAFRVAPRRRRASTLGIRAVANGVPRADAPSPGPCPGRPAACGCGPRACRSNR